LKSLTIHQLDNGMKILLDPVPDARSTSLSLWMAQGSRHELEGENGLTHFGEHLLFKGTANYSWKELAAAMNNLGGQFNACTSTDWVKLYGRVVSRDLPEALSLIAEMFLRSEFPENEVDRERDVILEEIAMYDDTPEDQCFEQFTQALLLPHPIGRPVLGTEDLVEGYSRDELLDYWQRSLAPADMVLSIAGAIDRDEALRLAEREFSHLSGEAPRRNGLDPAEGQHNRSLIDRDLEQVNFCFGVTGPKRCQEERFAWMIYDTILGGGMGSRLFDEVREKRGLAYSVGSSVAALDEAGYLAISGSTRAEYAVEAMSICLDEIRNMADQGPAEEELRTAKAQLERAHVLAMESIGVRAAVNGDRELYGMDHLSTEEFIERLRAVSHKDVQAIGREVIGFGLPAACLVGPLGRTNGLDAIFTPPVSA